MYTDFYLAFEDEAQAQSVLYTPHFEPDPDSTPDDPLPDVITSWTPNYANMSTLGTVYEPPPEPTPKGYEPRAYPSPNFGVNVRLVDGEDGAALEPYSVYPQLPQRVWA